MSPSSSLSDSPVREMHAVLPRRERCECRREDAGPENAGFEECDVASPVHPSRLGWRRAQRRPRSPIGTSPIGWSRGNTQQLESNESTSSLAPRALGRSASRRFHRQIPDEMNPDRNRITRERFGSLAERPRVDSDGLPTVLTGLVGTHRGVWANTRGSATTPRRTPADRRRGEASRCESRLNRPRPVAAIQQVAASQQKHRQDSKTDCIIPFPKHVSIETVRGGLERLTGSDG